MLVSIDTYEICNGTLAGGVAIGQARLNFDRVKDVAIPIDQVDPDIFDRVCHRLTFTFQVQRTHANAALAELFILDLDSNLPSSGTITLTPTGSGMTRTVPDGSVISHASNLLGATTTTTYTIVGGQPT